MDTGAMDPHGAALLAYLAGDKDACEIIRRDDGLETSLPVSHYFRSADRFSDIERSALDACHGRTLDVGAGSGMHSLELERRGISVTSLDISPAAVEVMRGRGLTSTVCADIFAYKGRFDTLLVLGNGLGLVETPDGLRRFLAHASTLLTREGQILCDSLDVRVTDDPAHLAYHEANLAAGRDIGSTRIRVEYAGQIGPYFGWLHVDPVTLSAVAGECGWASDVLVQQDGAAYLARLTAGLP